MSLYAAIDLHSTNNVLAILDEADVPVRQRRLPNDLPTILRELEPFRDEVHPQIQPLERARAQQDEVAGFAEHDLVVRTNSLRAESSGCRREGECACGGVIESG